MNSEFSSFNSQLKGIAQGRLQQRFDKIKRDNDLAQSLGYPIRRRPDVSKTFSAPSIKRKVIPRPTRSRNVSEPPEPALQFEEYEHILSIMHRMSSYIELSPGAVKDMGEEALRTLFLVQLNGHYEGNATGETFNHTGKTDILIKDNGKNLFIAECKFWTGAKDFTETLNQLLGYLSWRDTKTAAIIFNRNKNLSNVLQQIPDLARSHPNFVKDWKSSGSQTEFRYVFHHPGDKNRELFLTVQIYDVPV